MSKKTNSFWLLTPIAGAVAVLLFFSPEWVADRSLAQAVPDDRSYVIVARHADAPGRGEPAGFDLNDCSTQRNLSDKGRKEARDLGAAFRARGINVTKVLTSRWCRAQETAELMQLGPIESAAAFDNLELNKQHANELLDDERKLIASWRGPGVLLVISHNSNIKALTSIDPEQNVMFVVSAKQDRLIAKPLNVTSAIAKRCADCS